MIDTFVLPAFPTPNGRLHLGHIAGPYLASDIFARHSRQIGKSVYYASATDFFDLKSVGGASEDFFEAIKEDLRTMQIYMDNIQSTLRRI